MTVRTLDHVNIRTPDVPGTVAFFRDILGLAPVLPPGQTDIDRNCWMLDPAGRPIIHIGHDDLHYPSDPSLPFTPTRGSGALHHVALECDDVDDMLARLDAASLPVVRKDYEAAGLCQLFVQEVNGILLELNFRT